jgi:hypothetical protein
VARVIGEGKRVRIFGQQPDALCRRLEAQGCRPLAGTARDLDRAEGGRSSAAGPDGGPFDAIVVADLLGRIDDPQTVLRALKDQLSPEGSLILTLCGIAAVGDRLAKIDDGPLGMDSGVLFSEAGLVGLVEESQFAVGHIELVEPATDRPGTGAAHDWLIVAYPLPLPGLDFIQRRVQLLARDAHDARREAEELRQQAEAAAERIALYAGHEQRMAVRLGALRQQLLETHNQLACRDDELRQTFGDAIYQRHDLLIERDRLLQERAALEFRLHAAESRLDRLRSSPLGRVYSGFKKLLKR